MNNKIQGEDFEIIDDGRLTVIGYIRRGATEGVGLQYMWDGTKLGIKREDEEDYSWVDLGSESASITEQDIINALGYVPADKLPLDNHIKNKRIHVTEDEKYLISTIESKANKKDIPTKLSQLEMDIEVGKDYDEQIKIIMETKADKTTLAKEVERLEDLIFNIEPGQDLTEIERKIQELIESKADKSELESYMLKSDYDVDGDGIVDKAMDSNKLGGINADEYALKIDIVEPTIKWENIEDKPEEFKPSKHNHNDIYYQKEDIDIHTENNIIHVSQEERDALNTQIESILKSIEDLDIPEIPTEVLEEIRKDIESLKETKLDIDTFNKKVIEIESKIAEIKVPTMVSELENDAGYLTKDSSAIQIIEGEVSTLRINKADRVDLQTEVDKLNAKIDAIDVPEGVDLTEIKADISKLKTEKADKTYIESEIVRLEKLIEDSQLPEDELKDIKAQIEQLRTSKVDKETFNLKIQELEDNISKIKVPQNLSELNNDTGFITKEDIPVVDLTEIESDIEILKIDKANKTEVANEIARIEKVISELDIPEEVDLQPLLDSIKKLEEEKLNKIEFETRLSEEISKLIDNAPEALDTLGKLAQALGEDPEFATTITNLISKKVDTEKFNQEVIRLDKKIDSIDVPEGVDLTPIKKDIEDIKTKDSQQDLEIEKKINASDVSQVGKTGEYKDILNTPKIPSKTTDLENDSGFITIDDVPETDLSGVKGDIADIKAKDIAQDEEIANKINSSEISVVGKTGKYSDLKDKPTIPNKVGQLENDSGYITLEEVPKTDLSEIEASIEKLSNEKANKVDVDAKIKELRDLIEGIDIPEVDLKPIENKLVELEKNKAELTYVQEEIIRIEEMIQDIVEGDDSEYIIPRTTDAPILQELFYKTINGAPPVSHWYPDDWGVWTVVDQNHLTCVESGQYNGISTRLTENDGVIKIKIIKEDKSHRHLIRIRRDGEDVVDIRETRGDAEYEFKVKVGDLLTITSLFAGEVKFEYLGESEGCRLYAYKNGVEERIANARLVEKELDKYITRVDANSKLGELDDLTTEDKGNVVDSINEVNDKKADKSDILLPYHLGESKPDDNNMIWMKI